jgi:hypothetical protein
MRELKYVKLFENFEDFQTSDLTLNLLNEKITLDRYLNSIESLLNESILSGITQFFSNFKKSVFDGLFTFLKQAAKIGFKIFDSVFSLIKLAIRQISKFKEKNPILFKIIVTTLIVLFLMIVSASAACAKSAGKPIDLDKIDMAIGYLKSGNFRMAEGKYEGFKVLNQCLTYLIDLRDGKIDGNYTQRVLDISEDTIKTVSEYSKQAKKDPSSSIAQNCKDLLENGKEYLNDRATKGYEGAARYWPEFDASGVRLPRQ